MFSNSPPPPFLSSDKNSSLKFAFWRDSLRRSYWADVEDVVFWRDSLHRSYWEDSSRTFAFQGPRERMNVLLSRAFVSWIQNFTVLNQPSEMNKGFGIDRKDKWLWIASRAAFSVLVKTQFIWKEQFLILQWVSSNLNSKALHTHATTLSSICLFLPRRISSMKMEIRIILYSRFRALFLGYLSLPLGSLGDKA